MAEFLADKSALARSESRPEVRDVVEPLLLAGRIATCSITDMEVLFSAANPKTYSALERGLAAMPSVPITESIVRQAQATQSRLAELGSHRAVPIPDLIIAACAAEHGLVVLHYDQDFDRIASVTKQSTRWVVERGSVS